MLPLLVKSTAKLDNFLGISLCITHGEMFESCANHHPVCRFRGVSYPLLFVPSYPQVSGAVWPTFGQETVSLGGLANVWARDCLFGRFAGKSGRLSLQADFRAQVFAGSFWGSER